VSKLQRNAAGKLLRNLHGKIIRAVRCCCGQPPVPGCNRILYNTGCAADDQFPYIAATYKIVVSGVLNCSGCVDNGTAFGEVTGGSINRTYYVSFFRGATPDTESNAGGGAFFTSAATFAPGALGFSSFSDSGCTADESVARAYTVNLQFFGLLGVPGSGEAAVNIAAPTLAKFFAQFLFQPDPFVPVTNFCSLPNTIDNGIDAIGDCGAQPGQDFAIGYGGTAEVTPCPPCAVECDAEACVEITTSAATASVPDLVDPDGDFDYVGKLDWGGEVFPGYESGYGPAGCVWKYMRVLQDPEDDEADHYTLYVWYDGQDWRGMLTRSKGGVETTWFASREAGSLACTDNVLTGSLALESSDGSRTATVTLGACNCYDVTANIDSPDVAYFNGAASIPAGDYVVTLRYGAMTYSDGSIGPAQGYRVNAAPGEFYYAIVYNGGSDEVEAPPQGEYTAYSTEELHTSAHGGSTVTIIHTGGSIGIKLYDFPYTDNAMDADGRAPTFRLCPA
jgi:hypothetical protein